MEEKAAMSHLGGRMACLVGGCVSRAEVNPGLGSGVGSGANRIPNDPNSEYKTHAQTHKITKHMSAQYCKCHILKSHSKSIYVIEKNAK